MLQILTIKILLQYKKTGFLQPAPIHFHFFPEAGGTTILKREALQIRDLHRFINFY